MFTVALIGPDGAGKSTVTQELTRRLPFPTKYIYMGVNLEASRLLLPTTRLLLEWKRLRGIRPDMAGPPNPLRRQAVPKKGFKRFLKELKTGLRMVNLMAEEWFRQLVVWGWVRRGHVVLFDRHFFFDYYAADVAGQEPGKPLIRRLHGAMLKHLYPRPDLVILLDAPAEVLFARKQEGTVALLELRRQEYHRFQDELEHFVVVDASQPLEQVIQQVTDIIVDFRRQIQGAPETPRPVAQASQVKE